MDATCKPGRIVTERLVLEPLGVELATRLASGDMSGVTPGKGWPSEATLIVAARAAGDAGATTWLITRDGTVIGECGLKHAVGADGTAEIGYGLATPWRAERYGTEAIGGLVKWLERAPACRRVLAEVHESNTPSCRLLQRLGFTIDRLAAPYVWYGRSA